jgi:parallel beta-helix repeat protein
MQLLARAWPYTFSSGGTNFVGRRAPGWSFRPRLEVLESRCLPSTSQPLGSLAWLIRVEQAAGAAFFAPTSVAAPTVEVHAGQSIQAAVDAAQPGTVIFIDPGTYDQSVTIGKPDIILAGLGGPGGVVIQNPGGQDNGVTVDPGANGFALLNVTIQNFGANGVFLSGMRRFVIAGVTAINDGCYGIFPSQVANGLVLGCSASGNNDTGIYVGQSADVAVLGSSAQSNVNGIEVENSVNVAVLGNVIVDNTTGILVDLLPGLQVPIGGNTLVADNFIFANNHPNFSSPQDISSLEIGGVGVFVLGTTNTTIANNLVLGNTLIGIGVASSDLLTLLGNGPVQGIQPNPVHTRVRGNNISGAPLGADLLWDGSGSSNCWSDNTFQTQFSLRPFPTC